MAVTSSAAKAAHAFDGVAVGYAEQVEALTALTSMRDHARCALVKHVKRGSHVLELGCGPGLDAVWFAERGYYVTAIDVSSQMTDQARAYVDRAGMTRRVQVECLSIEAIHQLAPATFAAVYSGLGPLNCVHDTELAAMAIARRTAAGGIFIATVMGRLVPWEWLRFGLVGDLSRAMRRLHREALDVSVADRPVETRYFTPGELTSVFERAGMRLMESRGLCILAPPPYLDGLSKRHQRLTHCLRWMDDRLGALPGARLFGDHFLIVMRRSEPVDRACM